MSYSHGDLCYIIDIRESGRLVNSYISDPMSEDEIDAYLVQVRAANPNYAVTAIEHEEYQGQDDDFELHD